MDNLTDILDDLADHITVLKELGLRSVEIDPQVVRELTRPLTPAPGEDSSGGNPVAKRIMQQRKPLSRMTLLGSRPLEKQERSQALRELEHDMLHCFDCGLCKTRTKPVAGQGNPNSPDVMVIGPAPDAEDERTGQPFSGPSGELLSKMIAAMGYAREDLFVTNICKCRPVNDRAPLLKEMQACTRFLEEQIKIIRPKAIIVLGEHAIKGLFLNQNKSKSPPGVWTKYHGIPVMPTFHPKYILRFHNDAQGQQLQLKRSAWRALQAVMQLVKRT